MARYISIAVPPNEGRSPARSAAQFLRALRRGWKARTASRTLHRLSDHQLKDIGLRRSEVNGLFVR